IESINTTLPIKVNGQLIGAVEIGKDYSKIKDLSNKLMDLQTQVKRTSSKPREMNGATYTFSDIITVNPVLSNIKKQASKVGKSNSTVLIYGETGTGKELLVQAIHNASNRKQGP